ncbi:unnamed protein product [Bemisia tabaci]|uniref:Cyclin-dependent kinases regulatory subunit n=1 Tax=Bemisia tabaci TaxID=7038 RepID=A0A9P0AIW2_BEMTA|nr:PREDICTED: cyclin-dependent kinases regulatory subunit [Bemisia tabaci]CAH0391674.1 unnamed protein product [Bemisia tabaci]
MAEKIFYSKKYYDDSYEYRHVILPKELVKKVPRTHLMSQEEWRAIGVQMSDGWIHYMHHTPEPHILLFKRPLPNSEKKLVNGLNEMKVIENNC